MSLSPRKRAAILVLARAGRRAGTIARAAGVSPRTVARVLAQDERERAEARSRAAKKAAATRKRRAEEERRRRAAAARKAAETRRRRAAERKAAEERRRAAARKAAETRRRKKEERERAKRERPVTPTRRRRFVDEHRRGDQTARVVRLVLTDASLETIMHLAGEAAAPSRLMPGRYPLWSAILHYTADRLIDSPKGPKDEGRTERHPQFWTTGIAHTRAGTLEALRAKLESLLGEPDAGDVLVHYVLVRNFERTP